MSFKTYTNIKDFVQKKLDLQEESFITPEELLLYCEEAIKYCEAEIHKLNIEDQYFVSQAALPLTSGKSDYDMPTNIYANKILRAVLVTGSDIYTIRRITKRDRFEESELIKKYSSSSRSLEYMLVNNDARVGTRFRLYPTPTESAVVTSVTGNLTIGSPIVTSIGSTTGIAEGYFLTGNNIALGTRVKSVDSSTQITLNSNAIATEVGASLVATEAKVVVWFIRKASIPVATTDYIDFPEFWNFIAQHMIVECLKKELGNPRVEIEKMKLEELKAQVVGTLSNMVPDQFDELERDMSSYSEEENGY